MTQTLKMNFMQKVLILNNSPKFESLTHTHALMMSMAQFTQMQTFEKANENRVLDVSA